MRPGRLRCNRCAAVFPEVVLGCNREGGYQSAVSCVVGVLVAMAMERTWRGVSHLVMATLVL